VPSHETFINAFVGIFRARARKTLRGDDSYEWPFVMARPLEDLDSDAIAEFVAGDLIAPTPRSAPEPWQLGGVLYRDAKGPPIVGDLTVEHFRVDRKLARVEVTGTVLRGLPLGSIRDSAVDQLPSIEIGRDAMAVVDPLHVRAKEVDQARRAAKEAGKTKPGRPGYPDEHYRRIALRYLTLVERHRNVLVALATEESKRLGRIVPRETVRDWVRKATERGYLAPGKPGRAEARPGSKLNKKEDDDG